MKTHPTNSPSPVVDLIYYDESGKIAHRYVTCKFEPTAELLENWILDYYDRVSDGYIPQDFTRAPKPYCARIYQRGNLLAEWIKPEVPDVVELPSPAPSAESLVTAEPCVGRGGIPAVVPSTTASGEWAIRRSGIRTVSAGNHDLHAVNDACVAANFGAGQVSL